MSKLITDDRSEDRIAPVLLTDWANEEYVRLKAVYQTKRAQLVREGLMDAADVLNPKLKPIHDNILIHRFVFDPRRPLHGTGRVRMLLAMFSFVGSSDDDARELWPGLGTLNTMTGFRDRKNARQAIADLKKIGLLEVEPGAGKGGAHLYRLWSGHLIDMVFACATGETAIYALALRELRVSDRGQGKAYLSRKKVRDALAEGRANSDGTAILDRSLKNEMIVRHLEALRTAKPPLLLKVGAATATVPAALGAQKPAGGRFWERSDKGKSKPRPPKRSSFVDFAPLPEEIDSAPPADPSFVDPAPLQAKSYVEPAPPKLLGTALIEPSRNFENEFEVSNNSFCHISKNYLNPTSPSGAALPSATSGFDGASSRGRDEGNQGDVPNGVEDSLGDIVDVDTMVEEIAYLGQGVIKPASLARHTLRSWVTRRATTLSMTDIRRRLDAARSDGQTGLLLASIEPPPAGTTWPSAQAQKDALDNSARSLFPTWIVDPVKAEEAARRTLERHHAFVADAEAHRDLKAAAKMRARLNSLIAQFESAFGGRNA